VAPARRSRPRRPGLRARPRRARGPALVVLPSHVERWLAEQHRTVPEAPAFAPGCAPPGAERPPAIVTPDRTTVLLIPGLPARSQEIPFQATTRAPSVSWFVDGALVGTVPASERLYWPPVPGTHEVVVADDAGRKDRRVLVVRAAR
jgi:penicillin-binding protein 1C